MKTLLEKFKQWRIERRERKHHRDIERLQECIAAKEERVIYYTHIFRSYDKIPLYMLEECRYTKEDLAVLKVRLANLQK